MIALSIGKANLLKCSQNKRYVLSCVFKFLKVPGLNAAFNTFLVFLYNAVHSWGPILQEKRLLLQCDNSSSVILINTGRCRDKVMLGIARNIWLVQPLSWKTPPSHNKLASVCINWSGSLQRWSWMVVLPYNRVADLLSRWTEIRSPYEKITSLVDDCFIEEVQITSCIFDVDNSIYLNKAIIY
jgi:hypothetical protein